MAAVAADPALDRLARVLGDEGGSAGVAVRRGIFCSGRTLVDRNPSLRAHLIVRMLGDVEDLLPYVERIHQERRERWAR